MDRRKFLATAGRLGLGAGLAGLASIAGACGPTGPKLSSRLPIGPVVAVPSGTAGPSTVPSSPPPPPMRDTGIADENRRTGNSGWDLRGATGATTVQMFAHPASVAPGDMLNLHLRSLAKTTIEWYRLGWYGGAGGRLVRVDRHVPAMAAGPAVVDPESGRVEAPDPVALSVPIPADWPSGLYLAVARPSTGAPSSTPFSVRPAPRDRPAPVLFVSAAATWQAYNAWGGADLYDASTADIPDEASGRRAVQVSFDRPHFLQHGAGFMPRWELPFVRWQERNGRSVDYCADVDLELHPEVVAGRQLIVFAGHHEYWSRPMRATLELAIATGVNVAFLSANEIYWQIRLESSPLGPGRRITCWKSRLHDPIMATQPELTSCRWREQPVDDPEAVLIGQMYGHIVRRPADWIVAGSSHWLYESTRFRDGDRIVNLVGQEFDTFFPEYAQAGTTILARSPVQAVILGEPEGGQPADPWMQTATIHTTESGATVLAAGTFQWSWALDGYGSRSYRGFATPRDSRVERMTHNVFDRLGDGPLMA